MYICICLCLYGISVFQRDNKVLFIHLYLFTNTTLPTTSNVTATNNNIADRTCTTMNNHTNADANDTTNNGTYNNDDNVNTNLIDSQNNQIQDVIERVKILGLNVDGLRSKLRRGIFEQYARQFDILCLSETKMHHIDLTGTTIHDYSCYIKEKSISSHQYGGVHGLCMMVKSSIAEYAHQIKDTKCPYVLWIKFDKEAFSIPCIIGAIYLPCEGSKHKDIDAFDNLANEIVKLKIKYKLPICLVGDFNARTGNLNDTLNTDLNIVDDIELENQTNEMFDVNIDIRNENISRNRINKDTTNNENGKSLINFCQALNIKIINGRTGQDNAVGEFTFKNTIGKSTIDYCIASQMFLPYIQDFMVDVPDRNLSDYHSPIILTLKTKHEITIDCDSQQIPESDINYQPLNTKWCGEKKDDFKSNFDTDKIEEINQILRNADETSINLENIDDIVKKVAEISTKSGIDLGISRPVINRNRTPRAANKYDRNKPWFDKECEEKRKQYNKIKTKLKRCKSYQNEAALVNEARANK